MTSKIRGAIEIHTQQPSFNMDASNNLHIIQVDLIVTKSFPYGYDMKLNEEVVIMIALQAMSLIEYSLILTTSFYDIKQKILLKKGYFQSFI